MSRRTPRRRPLLESGRLVPLLVLVAAAPAAWLLGWARADWTIALLLYVGAISLLTLGLFAWDKRAAARDRRRVAESNLLLAALLGGAAGAFVGMRGLRHKTRHARFRILVPLALLVQAAALIALAASRG